MLEINRAFQFLELVQLELNVVQAKFAIVKVNGEGVGRDSCGVELDGKYNQKQLVSTCTEHGGGTEALHKRTQDCETRNLEALSKCQKIEWSGERSVKLRAGFTRVMRV